MGVITVVVFDNVQGVLPLGCLLQRSLLVFIYLADEGAGGAAKEGANDGAFTRMTTGAANEGTQTGAHAGASQCAGPGVVAARGERQGQ
jgi:hypothetical protein